MKDFDPYDRLQILARHRKDAEALSEDHLKALWHFRATDDGGRSLDQLPVSDRAVSLPMFDGSGAAPGGSVGATCAVIRSLLRNPIVQGRNLRPLSVASNLFYGLARSDSRNNTVTGAARPLSVIEIAQLVQAAQLLSDAIHPFAEQYCRQRDYSNAGYTGMGTGGALLAELAAEPRPEPWQILALVEVGCAEQAARDVGDLKLAGSDWHHLGVRASYSLKRLYRVGMMRETLGGPATAKLSQGDFDEILGQLESAKEGGSVVDIFGCSKSETPVPAVHRRFSAWWCSKTEGLDILTNAGAYLSEYISAKFVLDKVCSTGRDLLCEWLQIDGRARRFNELSLDESTDAHPYVLFWLLEALSGSASEDAKALQDELARSAQEEYYRLVARSSVPSAALDIVRLAFHLVIDVRFAPSRDLVIADAAARALSARQPNTADWPKGDRVSAAPGVGDVYPSAVEVVTCMLPALDVIDELQEFFDNCAPRLIAWLRTNESEGAGGSAVWSAPHASKRLGVDATFTADAYSFLHDVISYYNKQIRSLALTAFGQGTSESVAGEVKDLLEVLGDIRRGANEEHVIEGVKVEVPKVEPLGRVLVDRIVRPLETESGSGAYSLATRVDRSSALRSGILYGPPGTGKTTLVRRIATTLRWPLLSLSPKHFLTATTDHPVAGADRVFAVLAELRDCVVLFDEMEELLRTREPRSTWKTSDDVLDVGEIYKSLEIAEATNSAPQLNLFTTIMLPYLQQLHDEAGVLFFVATNYYDRLDPAVTRHGRFDFRLEILPPSAPTKIERILCPRVKTALQLGPQATRVLQNSCFVSFCQEGAYALYKGGSDPRELVLISSYDAQRRRRSQPDDGLYWQPWSIRSPAGESLSKVFPISDFVTFLTFRDTVTMANLIARDDDMRDFDNWATSSEASKRLQCVLLRALSCVKPSFFELDPEVDMLDLSGLVDSIM